MPQLVQLAGSLCRSGSSLCRTCPAGGSMIIFFNVTFFGIAVTYACYSAPIGSYYDYMSSNVSGWPSDLFPTPIHNLRAARSQATITRTGEVYNLEVVATAEFEDPTGVWEERHVAAQWEGTASHPWSPSITVNAFWLYDDWPDLSAGDPATPSTITWADTPDQPSYVADIGFSAYLFDSGSSVFSTPVTWSWPSGVVPDSLYPTRNEAHQVTVSGSGSAFICDFYVTAQFNLETNPEEPANWQSKTISARWKGSSLVGSYSLDSFASAGMLASGSPAASITVAAYAD